MINQMLQKDEKKQKTRNPIQNNKTKTQFKKINKLKIIYKNQI